MAKKKSGPTYAMRATDPKMSGLTTGIMTALLAPFAVHSSVSKWPQHKALLLKNPALARSVLKKLKILSVAAALPAGLYAGASASRSRKLHASALADRVEQGQLSKHELKMLKRMKIRA